jgi:hypothetical protein
LKGEQTGGDHLTGPHRRFRVPPSRNVRQWTMPRRARGVTIRRGTAGIRLHQRCPPSH